MWEEHWRVLTRRLAAWNATADFFLRHIDQVGALREQANQALAQEANDIVAAIDALELPPPVRAALDQIKVRYTNVYGVTKGERVVANRWVTLSALRIPLDEALGESEEPRRRLVDRAFLHLNRTLVVDAAVRATWQQALAQETRCEQLGALHLLAHGIYAFKADATSGRTDLILGEPLAITDTVKSAEAMVLTEWKVVRERKEAASKAREAKAQAERYARVELAGFELRAHRYIVLVSAAPIDVPSSEANGQIQYHYINVVVDRSKPSQDARRRHG
jgi:hypothetical protein